MRGRMKIAVVFSVPAAGAVGFCWKWRASDGAKQSHSAFAYFYECVQNARAAGYTVDLGSARDPIRDTGVSHGLK